MDKSTFRTAGRAEKQDRANIDDVVTTRAGGREMAENARQDKNTIYYPGTGSVRE